MEIIKEGVLNIEYDAIASRLGCYSKITNLDNNLSVDTLALFDTGATRTCVHTDLITNLDIKSIFDHPIYGFFGKQNVGTFHGEINLSDKLIFNGNVSVASFDTGDGPKYELIIGMDIISLGNFILTNHDDKTILSYICPYKLNTGFDFYDIISKLA